MAVLPVLFCAPALSCLTLHASFLDYFPVNLLLTPIPLCTIEF